MSGLKFSMHANSNLVGTGERDGLELDEHFLFFKEACLIAEEQVKA